MIKSISRKQLLFSVLISFSVGGIAQVKPAFQSFNTLQVLNGSNGTSLAVNTVNGVAAGRMFYGVGTGFDYYYHVSVPLFGEIRMKLASGKGEFQVFGNGGFNFPFSKKNSLGENKRGPFKTGRLYGAGLDYLVPIGPDALILGAAFSSKQVIQLVENNVWNPQLNRVENIPIREDYQLNRIALRLGWRF
jgi:hypothetical protein